jgi:hypothetical protein
VDLAVVGEAAGEAPGRRSARHRCGPGSGRGGGQRGIGVDPATVREVPVWTQQRWRWRCVEERAHGKILQPIDVQVKILRLEFNRGRLRPL